MAEQAEAGDVLLTQLRVFRELLEHAGAGDEVSVAEAAKVIQRLLANLMPVADTLAALLAAFRQPAEAAGATDAVLVELFLAPPLPPPVRRGMPPFGEVAAFPSRGGRTAFPSRGGAANGDEEVLVVLGMV